MNFLIYSLLGFAGFVDGNKDFFIIISGCTFTFSQDVLLSQSGGDIGTAQSLQACKDMCMAKNNCYGFNYMVGSAIACWLKDISLKDTPLDTVPGFWFYYKINCDTTTSSEGKFFPNLSKKRLRGY